MSVNEQGPSGAHKAGRTAELSNLRRHLLAEATTSLGDSLLSYRCRGCSERCINGTDETPAQSLLCVDCCASVLVDLDLTGRTDDRKVAAEVTDRC